MYYFKDSVHIEPDDQCVDCKNFIEGVACPLLQALALGMVSLEGNLYVRNCGFYEEFKRHLSVVTNIEEKKNAKEQKSKKENKDTNENNVRSIKSKKQKE